LPLLGEPFDLRPIEQAEPASDALCVKQTGALETTDRLAGDTENA
jgi:hypothetical protein